MNPLDTYGHHLSKRWLEGMRQAAPSVARAAAILAARIQREQTVARRVAFIRRSRSGLRGVARRLRRWWRTR